MPDDVDEKLEQLNDNYDQKIVSKAGDVVTKNIPRFRTEIFEIDRVLGGGVPRGRIISAWGQNGDGKTTLALLLIRAAQNTCRFCNSPIDWDFEVNEGDCADPDCDRAEPMRVALFDVEHTFEPEWAKALGCYLDDYFYLIQSEYMEQGIDILDCYDDQTEILTKDGWKYFDELTMEDRVLSMGEDHEEADYYPIAEIVEDDYSGEMIKYDSPKYDFCVTPNHDMYVGEYDSGSIKWEKKKARNIAEKQRRLGEAFYMKRSFDWVGQGSAPDFRGDGLFTVHKKNLERVDYDGTIHCVEVESPSNLVYVRRNKGSFWSGNSMVRSQDIDFMVVDSLAAMTPVEEIEKSAEDDIVGTHAKKINSACRKWQSSIVSAGMDSPLKPTIMLINQVRQDVGVQWGDARTKPGGKGQDFVTSIDLWLYSREEKQFDNDDMGTKSVELDFTTYKNKTFRPGVRGQVEIATANWPDDGIKKGDIIIDNKYIFDQARDLGMVQKSSSNWVWVPTGEAFGTYTELRGQIVDSVGRGNLIEAVLDSYFRGYYEENNDGDALEELSESVNGD